MNDGLLMVTKWTGLTAQYRLLTTPGKMTFDDITNIFSFSHIFFLGQQALFFMVLNTRDIIVKKSKCFQSPPPLLSVSLSVAFVVDNATMSSIRYFKNHASFFFKPKEVDPIKLISIRQVSLSIAIKFIINNSVQLFLFSLKMSITAILAQ